jgi:hypothetical protein
MSCGGMVDEEGLAMGDGIEEETNENAGEPDPDDESETAQMKATQKMRHFAQAVKVRR